MFILSPGRFVLVLSLACSMSCGVSSTPPEASPPPSPAAEAVAEISGRDAWWTSLESLCGRAYEGALSSQDAADADFAEKLMTMHVRSCEQNRLEIPFHVGDDRSRTWVLTRSEDGLHLEHDHRHEDGTPDEVTLYGGRTLGPGNETVQLFPADDYSKELFEKHGLAASLENIWSMEIIPGERFSYVLRRPGRHFQVDFDLTATVEPPPAPWGHE